MRSEFRGADDLLKRLRQSLPEIALWEQDDMNVHGLDMVRWFAVVKELRHATVHAGGLLSPAQWNRLGPTGLALLSVAAIVASMIISDHRSALVVGALFAISWPASRIAQRLILRKTRASTT